ncbi:phosphoglycolate phosphatase [Pseudoroseomonas rhizosphaerae]|uniref:Phosphoglycolate phosphatase n=1 Tax=Teichococcus rhizosphaerae TaxID=1335062 RepID=A0A2C7A9A9_9PROT|nr:HAD-IIB family hydrolase [Pseudoroseomonas rhizosphaerae]PHK93187.1 phosphoglycolate phosphatase [Pseudoroseomonas rhizosphaerae]
MYFLGLAADYDGTITEDRRMAPPTLAALRRLKETGRRLVLVTGRELPAILSLLPDPRLFDRIVAENGAVLHDPATGAERLLAPPPSERLLRLLQARGVQPVAVGRCILATWEPHQNAVLDAIHESGLELQISFNKGAVMVLPSGVNKATGLKAALDELQVSAANFVGVGDAENDHAFLRACGCAAAVANALPVVRRDADLPLAGSAGAGIVELAGRIIAEDAALAPEEKHGPWLGHDRQGRPVHLRPGQGSTLVLGRSGAGKSTLAKALTERMAERQLEFCVVDPEGDYLELENAVGIGSLAAPPNATEALRLISQAGVNVVVNTQALPIEQRQGLFDNLLHQAAHLRARTGRPHWLVLDEAHQLLPAGRHPLPALLDQDLGATILVTYMPDALAHSALATVRLVVAVGAEAAALIREVSGLLGREAPPCPAAGPGEALCWRPGAD